MNNLITASLLGLIISAAIPNSTNAQTTAFSPIPKNQEEKHSYNIHKPGVVYNAGALSLNDVNTKAIRSFKKLFSNTTNQQWYAVDRKKFLTTFTSNDGRASRALFANSGYMFYAISYGDERSLKPDQRRLIKSTYIDYAIGLVSEINTGSQKIWVVNLEDKDHIVIARLTDDGILEELEYFHKHLPGKKQRREK